MQRLKHYLIFSNPPRHLRFIFAIFTLSVLSNFPTYGQLMDSYVPIPEGQEFRCGPSEDCKRYNSQQKQLCGCVPGVVPYTTVPYHVEQE